MCVSGVKSWHTFMGFYFADFPSRGVGTLLRVDWMRLLLKRKEEEGVIDLRGNVRISFKHHVPLYLQSSSKKKRSKNHPLAVMVLNKGGTDDKKQQQQINKTEKVNIILYGKYGNRIAGK